MTIDELYDAFPHYVEGNDVMGEIESILCDVNKFYVLFINGDVIEIPVGTELSETWANGEEEEYV